MRHAAPPTVALRAVVILASAAVVPATPLAAWQAEPPDTLAVDSLVVTATPVPLPPGSLGSHVTVLRGDELRERGVTTVAQALRQRAGVTLVQAGSRGAITSLFLRGGESDYVQVMVDGVALNQPGGAVDLAGLTTEAVERIEIVRGPASALNGSDAVSGVVNVITRRGSGDGSPVGTLTLGGGTFGRVGDGRGDRLEGSLEVRGGDDRASYGVSLARYSTDGVFDLNNEHLNTVLTGSADFRVSARSHARITARLADRTYAFPTDGAGNAVDSNQESFTEQNTVGVLFGHRFGRLDGGPGSLALTGTVSLHDEETGTDDAPDGPADTLGFYGFQSLDDLRRSAAELRASWTATERLTLAAGGEVESQSIRSFSESLSQFGPSTSRSEESRRNGAGYVHAVAELGDVTARGGVRLEDNEQYGDFLTWQVGASWSPRAGTRVRGAAGRGIKEPTFFEAFATGFARGNPELEPERSRSWEVGVEQSLGGVARLEATWFDQRFRDLIQYTFAPPSPDDPNFFNVAEADARGLEVVLRAHLAGVDAQAEWTHTETEVVDAGFDEGPGATFVEGQPLIRRPEDQLRLSAGGPAGARVRWNASVGWVGERSDRDFAAFPAEPVTLDAYTTLDLGLEARLLEGDGPGVDLLLRAENLTDAEYEEAFGFPAQGRSLFVGARLRLGGER